MHPRVKLHCTKPAADAGRSRSGRCRRSHVKCGISSFVYNHNRKTWWSRYCNTLPVISTNCDYFFAHGDEVLQLRGHVVVFRHRVVKWWKHTWSKNWLYQRRTVVLPPLLPLHPGRQVQMRYDMWRMEVANVKSIPHERSYQITVLVPGILVPPAPVVRDRR